MERYQPYESQLQRAVRAAIAEALAERERAEHERERAPERPRESERVRALEAPATAGLR